MPIILGHQWVGEGDAHAQRDHFAIDCAVLRFDGHHPLDACLLEQTIDQRAGAIAMTERNERLPFEVGEGDLRAFSQRV
ncbi:hypothetical protein D3C86_1737020 [compost metagenome]